MRQIIQEERGLKGEVFFEIEQEKWDGRIHRHLVELRIDLETGRAIPDNWDAPKCHAASRRMCEEFGWERVISPFDKDRDGPRPERAPKRWESYRAMKSGFAIHDIEAEVQELQQQVENGPELRDALDRHGYILARGDRKTAGEFTLMIVDPAGDEHSLARRLKIKAQELNEFMRDVDREALPDIRQAQAMQQDRKILALEAERETVKHEIEWEEKLAQAAIEKEKIEARFVAAEDRPQQQEQEKGTLPGGQEKQPNWNRDRANQTWEDAVINAAIEQEKIERQFVDPSPGASQEAEKETRGDREKKQGPPTRGPALHIWNAVQYSDSPAAFAAALRGKGIDLAAPTDEEAQRSKIAAAYPKAIGGLFVPEYRPGEIVAMTERGQVWQLNPRTTGKKPEELQAFLAPLRDHLQGIEATKQMQQRRREEIHWPTMPPQPEPVKTSPALHFEDAAREATSPERIPEKQPFGVAARLKDAFELSRRPDLTADEKRQFDFARVIDEHGIAFAIATPEEAYKSHREAEFAKAIDRRAPEYRPGEIVAVTMPRLEVQQAAGWSELPRIHKLDQKQAAAYLKALSLNPKQLQGIEATKQKLDTKAQERKAERESDRMDRATWIQDWAPERGRKTKILEPIVQAGQVGAKAVEAAFDGAVNIASAALSFLDPPTTPAQREQAAELSRQDRETQAEIQIDFTRFTSDQAQRQQNHQEQQAARDRQREIERERF